VFHRGVPPGTPSVEEGPAPEEPPRPELPPDTFVPSARQAEKVMPGSKFGMRYMHPNVFAIYQQNQRKGKGDVVLRGDSLLGGEAPPIGEVGEDDRKRLEKSLLSEPGLSITEKRGGVPFGAPIPLERTRSDR